MINETKNCFFEKINVTDKPLSRFIKKKRERTQINKIRNYKGEVTTDTTEIQRIVRDYKATICPPSKKKKDNLEEMDVLRRGTPSKTEPGRNRNYKQTCNK